MNQTPEITEPPPAETHDFACPECPFTSVGWPSEAAAAARGEQHLAEHETGEPMPELVDANIAVDTDEEV